MKQSHLIGEDGQRTRKERRRHPNDPDPVIKASYLFLGSLEITVSPKKADQLYQKLLLLIGGLNLVTYVDKTNT